MHSCSKLISFFSFVAALMLLGSSFAVTAATVEREPDAICASLFKEYIVRSGKIPTEDVLAASDIIVSRGRTTGFWKPVLEGMRTVKGWDEIRYVRILGKMLAEDAQARDNIKSGRNREMQMASLVCLPQDVVPELISRAEKAEPYVKDAYIVALARARDPRAKVLLLQTAKADDSGGNWTSLKFHAALGLAELGDPIGVEWLIAHADDEIPTITLAWPQCIPNRNLDSCTLAALRVLSGNAAFKTKAEFETWWKTAAATWAPKNHVYLVDRW